jgi:hypothetical protein
VKNDLKKEDLAKQMHSSCALLDVLKKELINIVSLLKYSNMSSQII